MPLRESEVKVLLALYREGVQPVSSLRREASVGAQTAYTALSRLIELGLVEEELINFPKRRLVRLTERGRKVAELYAKAEELLREAVVEKEALRLALVDAILNIAGLDQQRELRRKLDRRSVEELELLLTEVSRRAKEGKKREAALLVEEVAAR